MARPVTKKPLVVEPPTITQEEIEYKGHTIHTEPHGRVIVSKLGLHVTEFIDSEAKLFTLVDKAKEYIDNGSL